MTTPTGQIVQEIYDEIDARKTASDYVVNNFDLVVSNFPAETYHEVAASYPNGVLLIYELGAGDIENEARGGVGVEELFVQVGLIRAGITVDSATEIENLKQLFDEVKSTCIKLPTRRHFSGIIANKDVNDLPYSFTGMNKNLFMAVFTARYQVVRH